MSRKNDDYIDVSELAVVARTHTRTIERLVYFELVRPAKRQPKLLFAPDAIPRVRHLLRLHIELGVGWSSMDVVLKLIDRIRDLEQDPDEASADQS